VRLRGADDVSNEPLASVIALMMSADDSCGVNGSVVGSGQLEVGG